MHGMFRILENLKFTNTHAIGLTEFIHRIYMEAEQQAEDHGGEEGGGEEPDAGFEYDGDYNAGGDANGLHDDTRGLPQQAEQTDDYRTAAAAANAAVVRGGLGLEDKAAEGEEWAAAMSPGAGN